MNTGHVEIGLRNENADRNASESFFVRDVLQVKTDLVVSVAVDGPEEEHDVGVGKVVAPQRPAEVGLSFTHTWMKFCAQVHMLYA
jgi:hypothetical protein